jgi:haloalkane dehalogenase
MAGLVVMNTSIGPPKPGFKPTSFHRFFSTRTGQLASTYLGLPQKRLGAAQGDRKSISGLVQKSYSFPLARSRGNEAVVALVRLVPDDLDHPSVEPLTEVAEFATSFEGPSAIVWGDRDPVLGRLRKRISRMLPDAEVTVTEAGHFLQEEVPEEIAAAIKSVVARV